MRHLVPSTVVNIKALQYTFRQQPSTEKDASYVDFHVITNHPTVYSKRWKENLESITGHSFHKYDAIIVGHHNAYDPRYATKAQLWIRARLYAKKYPEQKIDFVQYPDGVTVKDVAEHYNGGPIIWASMFSYCMQRTHQRAVQQMEDLKKTNSSSGEKRAVMRAINARQYIDEMDGEECSSDSILVVATCEDRSSKRYQDGHRCIGDKGGQPDLLVWDLVETLWELFS